MTKTASTLTLIIVALAALGLYLYLRAEDPLAPTPSPSVSTSASPSTSISGSPASSPSTAVTPFTSQNVIIDVPLPNATIRSPLVVTGKARGTWYFEASFPIKILDATGKVIATGHAEALGDWMTSNFVSFRSVPLSFSTPVTATGTLVLEKDNPSGLPQNDASVSMPIRFR